MHVTAAGNGQKTYRNRAWFARQLRKGTVKDIARITGLSVAGCEYWKATHGLYMPGSYRANRSYLTAKARRTYARRSWLYSQRVAGKTLKKIAAEVGVSPGCIDRWIGRHGLRQYNTLSLRARQTYANRRWVLALYRSGKSDQEMAVIARCTVATIKVWRRRFGLRRTYAYQPRCAAKRLAFGKWLTPRLARLPVSEDQRQSLTRYYGVGHTLMSMPAIACVQGTSRQCIYQRLRRALALIARSAGPSLRARHPVIFRRVSSPS